MPKLETDYSGTIIYKISCRDTNITDVYVGHTTNYVQRRIAHKNSCTNEKSINYKCKLYDYIRTHGGWSNWKIEIIDFFDCKDKHEALQKEQDYYILLKATLNSIAPVAIHPIPNPTPKPNPKPTILPAEKPPKQIYKCEKCNVYCMNSKIFEMHIQTNKHKKKSDVSEIASKSNPKNPEKYFCEKCDYITRNKTDYRIHTLTIKHKNNNSPCVNDSPIIPHKTHKCGCGKVYKHRSGLCIHRKTCVNKSKSTYTAIEPSPLTNNFVPTQEPTQEPAQEPSPAISHDIIYTMFKELCTANNEFKQMLLDQQNKMTELSSIIESNNS